MSGVVPSSNRHLRRKDLDAETILNLISIEDSSILPDETDGDLGLSYSPLEIESIDEWEIDDGPFNHPPKIVPFDKTEYLQVTGHGLVLRFAATDANNDSIVWSKTGPGEINPDSGIYIFNPNDDHIGTTQTVVVTATDVPGAGITPQTDTFEFTITVRAAYGTPDIRFFAARTAQVGVPYVNNIRASDPNNDPLTFTKDVSFGDLDATTGVFTFTPTAAMAETAITFTATNAGGLSASRVFNLTVVDNGNRVPRIISPLPNVTVVLNQRLLIQVNGFSNSFNYNTLLWNVESSSGSINQSGLFSYVANERTGPYSKGFSITLTDGDGLRDSKQFWVRVVEGTSTPGETPAVQDLEPRLNITSRPLERYRFGATRAGSFAIGIEFVGSENNGDRITADTSYAMSFNIMPQGGHPNITITGRRVTSTSANLTINFPTAAVGSSVIIALSITVTSSNGLMNTEIFTINLVRS